MGIWQNTLHGYLEHKRGKKIGVREEVEDWMKQKKIGIMGLHETRIGINSREARKEYTWYFSGEKSRETNYTAGVAIVIANDWVKFIIDTRPINDRIISITLKGKKGITYSIISVYIPQAGRPIEEKIKIYTALQK